MDFDYPDFTLENYRQILDRLQGRSHIVNVRDAMEYSFHSHTLILRHDVDHSPCMALPMAEIEQSMEIHSTYFMALHLYYNPQFPKYAHAIRRIATMGHEIGLHYDGNLYTGDEVSAHQNLALLEKHIHLLEELCGRPVISIAMHNPSLMKHGDPLRKCGKYHNAYDEKLFQDTVYISDSCGAWRANGLKPCWHEPHSKRIYLLIHPEIWGETARMDRMAYFEAMRTRVLREYEAIFDEVGSVWRKHSGGKEHDERVRLLGQVQ